jgi:hypothetical protein
MMTVDEALEYAQNALERAFEDWLESELPSGDCESVHRQWDDSFAHLELVDELQPVMALTWEVRRLQAENERLRKDAERYQWLRAKARTGECAPDGLYIGVDSEKFIGRWALFGSAADKAIDAARSAK